MSFEKMVIDHLESICGDKDLPDVGIYYKESFLHDLSVWFAIDRKSFYGCSFVGFIDRNPSRPCSEMLPQGTKTSHLFAAMVYLTILATQLIWRELGEDVACGFCKAQGWPIFSAGLGGFLHPIQMVSEAHLLPLRKKKYLLLYSDCIDKSFPMFEAMLPVEVRAPFADEVSRLKDWIWAEVAMPFPRPLVSL